ncbi:MAG: hypothetical protein AAGA60_25775 [Cyanobacteria bacterium P01_E01_bin.42]
MGNWWNRGDSVDPVLGSVLDSIMEILRSGSLHLYTSPLSISQGQESGE